MSFKDACQTFDNPKASQIRFGLWPLQILLAASKVVADKLYEFATDRFGSHVARRIIALAGGVDGQGSSGAGFGGERSGGVSHTSLVSRVDLV